MARHWTGLAIVLVLLVAEQASSEDTSSQDGDLRPVTLQLKWKHQFQFAGYYVAKEHGLYRAAGLDVAIVEHSDGASVESVASGDAEFGVSMSDLVVHRARGVPVVAIASIFQHSPLVLLVRGDRGIDNLHALDGHDVMIEPHAAELLAYLESERMPISQLTVHPHSFGVRSLLEGTVDAMSAYLTDEPFEVSEAGVPFSLFTPRSGGIDFYGDTLYTSESMIEEDPEVVAAFRSASIAGWRWAMDHPEATVDLILEKYSDRHSREHLLFEAEQTKRLVLPDVIEIGYMNPGRWRYIADVYASLGVLPPNLDFGGFLYDPTPVQNLTRFYAIAGTTLAIGLIIAMVAFRYYRITGLLRAEITDRKTIEASLSARESELEVLMTNLPGMAYRCLNDREWNMDFVSRGCRPLTGYEPEDLTGDDHIPYSDLINPDDRERVWRDVQAAVAEGCAFRTTYRITTAAGEERWVWEQGRMTEGLTGETRLEGFITDVTDLKEAEHAREALISDLRTAFDEINVLRGIIPICAGCKRIRDDQGYWNQLETYISERSEADFSHGICPECQEKWYGDIGLSGSDEG